MTRQQRFARFVTTMVVRVPATWRLFRGPLERNFDRLAPQWDATRVSPERLLPLRAALEAVPSPPARVLDLGTGSGAAARLAAELWPDAQVVGVDLSPRMIDEARRLASSERERYDVADSSALGEPDGSFDLVTLNNMIPFFDEVARVVAPGGHVAVSYSLGPRTPIYVPFARVRSELAARGFAHVADFEVGTGESLLARKSERS
ncbi:MAG TPA: methyltransferase domain-containing protein [Gaiellaceae bacterium]|nr:methyltransferase domain-containing protein [Gaiellaceae bacterium]